MAGLWFEYIWEDHVATGLDHYICSSFIALTDTVDGEEGTIADDFLVYNSVQFPAEQEEWGLENLQKVKRGEDPFADEAADNIDSTEESEEGRRSGTFKLDDLQRESTFFTYSLFWEPKDAETGYQRARAAMHRELGEPEDVDADSTQVANWDKTVQFVDTDYHSYAMGLHCEQRTNEDGSQSHTEDYFVWTRAKQPSMYMRKRARDALLKEGLSETRINQMNKGSIFECWGKDHHF